MNDLDTNNRANKLAIAYPFQTGLLLAMGGYAGVKVAKVINRLGEAATAILFMELEARKREEGGS